MRGRDWLLGGFLFGAEMGGGGGAVDTLQIEILMSVGQIAELLIICKVPARSGGVPIRGGLPPVSAHAQYMLPRL